MRRLSAYTLPLFFFHSIITSRQEVTAVEVTAVEVTAVEFQPKR